MERSCYMKRKSEHEIMAAQKPEDIFTMDPNVIELEKEEYVNRFKPVEYRAIQNFRVTRKVMLLYEEAIIKINDGWDEHEFSICSKAGKEYCIHYNNHSSFKLGEMYITSSYVIYVVEGKYKKYYENYVEKTRHYLKPDKHVWELVQYMVPDVQEHFETTDGRFCIFVKKPCDIYSLREVVDYFGGSLKPEYVASILTRLYYFACYMSLVEATHNGITVDNLFFAPGRKLKDGEEYTVHDMRIVGVYGGWFFTTYLDDRISGVPREVYEVMPDECKERGYSSFEVDELSIKRVAKDLFEGRDDVPKALAEWLDSKKIAKDPYIEFQNWEQVRCDAFGKRRFVDIDVSI